MGLYLFLLCGEYLSSLLWMAKWSGRVKVRVAHSLPIVTHLLFADNYLIFSEASQGGVVNLLELLNDYSNCSGQVINIAKSSVFFSSIVVR